MKIFVRFMIFILVLGLAGPFFLKRPDGRTWMQMPDVALTASQAGKKLKNWWVGLSRDAESFVKGPSGDGAVEHSSIGESEAYRWRDEYGNLVYSDEPRANGNHEIVVIGQNQTVVPATKPRQSDQSTVNDSPQDQGFTVPLPMTVSPSEASKLMEDAKQVSELMENREKILDQL